MKTTFRLSSPIQHLLILFLFIASVSCDPPPKQDEVKEPTTPELEPGQTAPYNTAYETLKDAISTEAIPCNDDGKGLFESYFQAIFPNSDPSNWSKLSTTQLQAVYRSLLFYYYCTPNSQPDGGWYGDYWLDRINDDPFIKYHYVSNWTNTSNEVFLFDDLMDKYNVAPDSTGISKGHSKFWGNRMFLDYTLGTLRRGMRNSPQVLNGAKPNPKYGLGGYPGNVYLEMLAFPQEHYDSKYPQGCKASECWCDKNDAGGDYGTTICDRYPDSCRGGQTWFYPSQGNGMFWDIGNTAYCYSYVDAFLNCPPGVGGDLAPVPGHPDSSLYNILVYLSRKAVPKGETDPRTGLPGSCSSNPCDGASFYGSFSLDKQVGILMGQSSYWYDSMPDSTAIDRRKYITGWTNGKWYGYPEGDPHYPEGIAPYGLETSESNPFIYTDGQGNELYKTWYGKPLNMSSDTALLLVAEMYSCGDNGWEHQSVNWPFGSYFAYGEDLGIGKYWVGQVMTAEPWNCTTVQFTMTPTSLSSSSTVMPAYDFELMYFQESGSNWQCVCKDAMTLDPTADFGSSSPGKELLIYASPFKGVGGGYLTSASNPQPFDGTQIGLSNFTTSTSSSGTFNPFLDNEVSGKSNQLDPGDCN